MTPWSCKPADDQIVADDHESSGKWLGIAVLISILFWVAVLALIFNEVPV